jgi:nucleoside-diphosphate-sugar epimerase
MRLSTAFGQSYRPRFDLVVNLLTARAVKEGKIKIFNGFQWRPFIHVEDISKAILLFLEAPVAVIGGEIFNVGSNNMNYRISDLGDKIKKIIPGTKIVNMSNQEDPRNYKVSFDKIRNRIGFSCRKKLEDGIIERSISARNSYNYLGVFQLIRAASSRWSKSGVSSFVLGVEIMIALLILSPAGFFIFRKKKS